MTLRGIEAVICRFVA